MRPRVVEAIKSDIIFGRLRPREHLVEDQVAAQCDTSRHVVRGAFVVLEQMGLVVRRPSRGAVVRDFSVSQVTHIYDVRRVLQAEAGRLVPCPADARTLVDLEELHTAYCSALEAGDLLAVNVLNDAFHRRIWATCPNDYLADLIERLWVETTGIRWYGVGDRKLLGSSCRDHARMIAQLREGDRSGFIELCVDHILPPLEAFRRAHDVGMEAFGRAEPHSVAATRS